MRYQLAIFDMDGTIAKWRNVPVEETRKPGYYADLEPEVELLDFMRDAMKVPFYFGGTSLLIVVVVIMDFMAQVQTLMMSSQYESALKKANLKGYGR